jgi:ArsR family transcriptional regulator
MKKIWTASNGKERAMTPEVLDLVAARFRVLAEPVWLRILHALVSGQLSVNAIAASVESTQPNVSKHLRILEDAGLITRRQEGNTV